MMKNRKVAHILASSIAALLVATTLPTKAATLTWDNGAATGNWNTTDANFGGVWTNGNDALFGGPATSTVTLTTPISATGLAFNVTGDTIAGNALSLTGTPAISTGGNTATINSILDGTAGVVVEGGGTVNFGGLNTIRGGSASGNNSGLNVGNTTANNTVNIANGGKFATIAANFRSLSIGNSTFGGNTVNISTSGTSASPSYFLYGNSAQLNMGVSSSNNQLNITNGALVSQTSGGGTNTSSIGTNAGANGNAILVDGVNSVFSRSGAGGSYLNVGAAGDNNSVTIQNGGTFNTNRLAVGSNGGDGNIVKATGAGSLIFMNGGSNAFFDVGTTTGSLNNAYKVEAGAKFNFSGSGTSRYAAVGVNAGATGNSIQVTGVGSTMNANFGLPIGIGAKPTGTTLTAGGNSNSLNVYDGGAFLTVTPIYVGATVALGGAVSTGNSVNLGNGTANTASLTIGASAAQFNTAAGYDGTYTVPGTTAAVAVQASSYTVPASGSLTTQGINLIDSTSALTFNNGRLVAGGSFSGTPLVSGLGAINLAGPAYISTESTNSIATAISGIGSFTKEGAGTLTLSGANTYSGDTSVHAGTLSSATASL
ncbi:MAG: autotransporter-associated beta strand repeat-containing protein, partial [Verrucomicrobia bacterium]|nr:autotransporter-associated beta strand repeat-containing protein [Verrucomicrobiota bacterium]